MTRARYKTAILGLGTFASIAFLAGFYLSQTADVERLRKEYPHPQLRGDKISYPLSPQLPKDWVPLKRISKFAKGAIVLTEDWGFYQHEGLDLEQMKIAIREIIEGKRFRGASTISQQLVKNVFLSSERTIWRKLQEVVLTHKLERSLPKDRILEIYLNVIEYGPGVYGIRKASRYYFDKEPSDINPLEGAFLAMLLPSPKRYSLSFRKKKLSLFAKTRIQEILVKMRMGKLITASEYGDLRLAKFSWETSDEVP